VTELGDNPRYANYARAHGNSPEDQAAIDRGKLNTPAFDGGFTFWNRDRIRDFQCEHPEAFMPGPRGSGQSASLVDHDAYDAWLTKWVDENKAAA
jgi:hypothetical protein